MRLLPLSILLTTIVCLCSTTLLETSAQATPVAVSSGESTFQKNCDLCRLSSVTESSPPSTLQPYRQRHPRASRPHRLPKGRYTIKPSTKPAASSSLGRMLSRRLPVTQSLYTIDGDTVRRGSER